MSFMREYHHERVPMTEPHQYEIDFKSKVSIFLTVLAVTYLCSYAVNQLGYIKSMDSNGFTITWTLGPTPSAGTLTVVYLAFR